MNSNVKTNLPAVQRNRTTPLDHLFNDFVSRSWGPESLRRGTSVPPVDISETAEEYRFSFDLPGLTRNDLELSCEDNVLTVRGERRSEQESQWHRHLTERFEGRFTRSFSLPKTAAVDGIEARFENGVLYITVPKAEQAKVRHIDIG